MSTMTSTRSSAALDGIAVEDNPAHRASRRAATSTGTRRSSSAQLDHVTGDLVVSPKNEDEVIRVLAGLLRARRAGHAARRRHRQLRPGHAALRRRRAQPRRHEQGEVDRARPGRRRARRRSSPARRARRGPQPARSCASIPRPTARRRSAASSPAARAASARSTGAACAISATSSARASSPGGRAARARLAGWDLLKVMHAYGTNGIITEVEMPLDAAYDWVDVIVGYRRLHGRRALRRPARQLQDGLLFKEIAAGRGAGAARLFPPPPEVPAPRPVGRPADGGAARARPVRWRCVAREKAEILYPLRHRDAEEKKGLPPVYELAWNHTTLRGAQRRSDHHLSADPVPRPRPSSTRSGA